MRILKNASVCERIGWKSATSPYDAIKAGLLTKFVKIGERAVGIPEHEVDAILGARIAGQNDDQVRELVKRLHAKRAELIPELMRDVFDPGNGVQTDNPTAVSVAPVGGFADKPVKLANRHQGKPVTPVAVA